MEKHLAKEVINLQECKVSKKISKVSKIKIKFLIKNIIFFTTLLLVMIIITKINSNTANEIIQMQKSIYDLTDQEKECRNDIIRLKQRNENFITENRNFDNYMISLNKSIPQLKVAKNYLILQVMDTKNKVDVLRYSKEIIVNNISVIKNKIEADIKQYNELEILNGQYKKHYLSLSKVSQNEYQKPKSLLLSKEEITFLEERMSGKIMKKCYSSNSGQLNATIFHQNCDQVGPTLTVVLTNFNEIVGGYTRVS